MVQIAVFGAATLAGLFPGGFVPKSLVRDTWRLPIALIFIVTGIAIAMLAWTP